MTIREAQIEHHRLMAAIHAVSSRLATTSAERDAHHRESMNHERLALKLTTGDS